MLGDSAACGRNAEAFREQCSRLLGQICDAAFAEQTDFSISIPVTDVQSAGFSVELSLDRWGRLHDLHDLLLAFSDGPLGRVLRQVEGEGWRTASIASLLISFHRAFSYCVVDLTGRVSLGVAFVALARQISTAVNAWVLSIGAAPSSGTAGEDLLPRLPRAKGLRWCRLDESTKTAMVIHASRLSAVCVLWNTSSLHCGAL